MPARVPEPRETMSESTTVYVVTKGDYSDTVVAVFSSPEKAQAFIDAEVEREIAPWKDQRPPGTEARLRGKYDIQPFEVDTAERLAREAK